MWVCGVQSDCKCRDYCEDCKSLISEALIYFIVYPFFPLLLIAESILMGMYLSGLFRMVFWLFCSIRAISTREKALISPVLIYILWNKIRDFFWVVLQFFGGCIDYLLSCSLLFILSSVVLDRLFYRLFVWAVFLIFDQL